MTPVLQEVGLGNATAGRGALLAAVYALGLAGDRKTFLFLLLGFYWFSLVLLDKWLALDVPLLLHPFYVGQRPGLPDPLRR